MSDTITITTRTDSEGCIIASATCGDQVCHYDGDDYTGSGSDDQSLRDAAQAAQLVEATGQPGQK